MASFSFVPHRVETKGPQYNVLKTEMSGMRRKTRLVSTEPDMGWKLYFRIQNNTERDAILAHYMNHYGELTPFYWTSIPSHISSETSIYVRYVSYEEEPILYGIWNLQVEFESCL